MTKQDWIILRLLRASTQGFNRMTPQGQRDFVKTCVYITDQLTDEELVEACDQLAEERAVYETPN
jgi:hypothetical protein